MKKILQFPLAFKRSVRPPDAFDEPGQDHGDVGEYVAQLLGHPVLRQTVCCHRVLPAGQARYGEPARPLPGVIRELLAAKGIGGLYEHQSKALDLARSGRHVAVATPTASGKTLVYALPVLERLFIDPEAKALFLFPLKALAQDQLRGLSELLDPLPPSGRPTAAIYDGDTPESERRKIRLSPPAILMSNPEMLHLGLLAHHQNWATFFANLSFVVVDEVHTYRGVMGSHMAHVFRRLLRVCARFGASPTFIFCSATVGNPGELAGELTGLPVTAITESGAPSGVKHVIFVNPLESAASASITLLRAALPRGLRTIVYCGSRKMTELISIWAAERSGKFAAKISAYRSGFLPEERREIEEKMASGELLAVISTSALELGIDIGGLDVCVLAGYPGTVVSTWQRGGRVGRAGRESLVVLIAGEDALDQYFMRHPEDFFDRPPESAVVSPANPVIAARHLDCAAAELPLSLDEPYAREQGIGEVVAAMIEDGRLLLDAEGRLAHSARKRPHRDVDLRGTGRRYRIQTTQGESIGEIDGMRAFRETHPGAVYLHRGVTYLVTDLDLETLTVTARPAMVDYYTRARGRKDTEILEIKQQAQVFGTQVFFGRLKVCEEITGYERRRTRGGTLLGIVPLTLPPLVFETEGVWFAVPREIQRAADDGGRHFMGGIHAVEHAAIGILPLLVMADRNDLGGISTPMHPQVGQAAVFIYDGVPGGVGLTRQAFAKAGELFTRTLAAVAGCPCESGCPSCVHSPKCGSGNRPIDKDAAVFVLEGIISGRPDASPPAPSPVIHDLRNPVQPKEPAMPASLARPGRFAVLDVETRRSADEVGGWHKAGKMGVSVAVLYDSASDGYTDFQEQDIPALAETLRSFDLVVGFNIKRFDYAVLAGVHAFDYHALPCLDLLEAVHARLGYRLSLDSLASATLGAQKSADGLQALRWWKEGRIAEIAAYCRKDVGLTRDLYLYGREHGHLLFKNKAGVVVRVPVDW